MSVDCEYEMGGVNGPVCAWSPGACKSWCRSNAKAWAPIVFEILKEVSDGTMRGFGVHVDVLNHQTLRSVLACASLDDHLADMHVETLESLEIDGIFGMGSVLGKHRDEIDHATIKCKILISGIWRRVGDDINKVVHPSQTIINAWNLWEHVTGAMLPIDQNVPSDADWKCMMLEIERVTPGVYKTRRAAGVLAEPEGEAGVINESDAMDALARAMSDDFTIVRMSNSRLFYKFECKTHPWIYGRRRALASIFDVLANKVPSLISRNTLGAFTQKYTFSPMGPKTLCYGGNIHITMKRPAPANPAEIAWGSSAETSFEIDLDPRREHDGIKIVSITSW